MLKKITGTFVDRRAISVDSCIHSYLFSSNNDVNNLGYTNLRILGDPQSISHDHPVHKIEVFSDKQISNVRLVFDNKFVVNLIQINQQNYVYNFSSSINFSRIDNIYMLFDVDQTNDDDITVNIFSYASNVMRFYNAYIQPYYV